MANSTQYDSFDSDGRAHGQPPIVLARLPRVGESLPTPAVDAAPAAPVPAPEEIPALELHHEIEQRTRLQVATPPLDERSVAIRYFADQHHAKSRITATPSEITDQPVRTEFERREESLPQTDPAEDSAPTPKLHKPASTRRVVVKPASLGKKLSQLQVQVAPHAGLIVALALITSAGLLYWMIVGPAQSHVPSYHNYGDELGQDAFGTPTFTTPSPAPETVNETPQLAARPEQPEHSPGEWTKMTLPTPPPQELPVTEQPPAQFPTTASPQGLDFSKLEPSPSADALRPLPALSVPEVATRPATSTTR